MSFVTPWLFGAAVAASLVVVGLHLLSVRTPPPMMLPTARFVPDGEARAVARQPRLNDVLLLLLRVSALLAAGAALAGIRWPRTTASELRLVIAEERLPADSAWRDSVTRALAAEGSLVEVSGARGMAREAGAAMVAAVRRAGELTTQYPTLSRVDLTVVLPTSSMSLSGFEAWRAAWPGRVRIVTRAAPAPLDSSTAFVEVRGGGRDDIVASALASGANGTSRRVIVERGESPGNASADADVHVRWPVRGIPTGWSARVPPDTIGAIVTNGEVVVGPFVRTAQLPAALESRFDSTGTSAPTQVIAWWSDGEPAVIERATVNGGCDRDVAVVLPSKGDLLLSSPARELRDALVAPCGSSARNTRALSGAATAGTDSLAPARAFRLVPDGAGTSDPWWLAPALLAIALLSLLAEWWVRAREVDA